MKYLKNEIMEYFENVPQVCAYVTNENLLVLIEKKELVAVLSQYKSIDCISDNVSITCHKLEKELNTMSDIYIVGENIEISNLSKLNEKLVRCSSFSTYM